MENKLFIRATEEDLNLALIKAVRKGQYENIHQLVSAGANVNIAGDEGFTPLILAAAKGRFLCITELVTEGADGNISDIGGATPLIWAARTNNIICVTTLLKAGADVNDSDMIGITPLTWAAYRGNVDCVNTLLRAGADVNASGVKIFSSVLLPAKMGKMENKKVFLMGEHNVATTELTPLMMAVSGNNDEVVNILLKAGADVKIKNSKGFTALGIASILGHEQCALVLWKEWN